MCFSLLRDFNWRHLKRAYWHKWNGWGKSIKGCVSHHLLDWMSKTLVGLLVPPAPLDPSVRGTKQYGTSFSSSTKDRNARNDINVTYVSLSYASHICPRICQLKDKNANEDLWMIRNAKPVLYDAMGGKGRYSCIWNFVVWPPRSITLGQNGLQQKQLSKTPTGGTCPQTPLAVACLHIKNLTTQNLVATAVCTVWELKFVEQYLLLWQC